MSRSAPSSTQTLSPYTIREPPPEDLSGRRVLWRKRALLSGS